MSQRPTPPGPANGARVRAQRRRRRERLDPLPRAPLLALLASVGLCGVLTARPAGVDSVLAVRSSALAAPAALAVDAPLPAPHAGVGAWAAWLPLALDAARTGVVVVPTAAPPTPRGARTWRVPGDAGTIGEALSRSASGDTVAVAAGTYRETGLVVPPGVALIGAGRDATVIDAGGTGTPVTLRDASLEGFTVRGAGGAAPDVGVRVAAGTARVGDCVVADSARGIVADCPGDAACRLVAERNVITPIFGEGIRGPADGSLEARRNTLFGARVGIAVGAGGTVEENIVARCEQAIVVADGGSAVVRRNLLSDNGDDLVGPATASDNLVADPLFRSEGDEDYRPTAGSPRLPGGDNYGAIAFTPRGAAPTGLALRTDEPADSPWRRALVWDDDGAVGYTVYLGPAGAPFIMRVDAGTDGVRFVLDVLDEFVPAEAAVVALSSYDAAGDESALSALVDVPAAGLLAPGTVRRVPADHPTIAAALAAAAPGDTVVVAPGTYAESMLAVRPGVTLLGRGWQRTIIDAGGAGHVLTPAAGSVVEGFTIRGSKAAAVFDSGVWINRGAVTLRRNRITGNMTGVYAWCFDAATCDLRVTLEGNLIDHNAGAGVNANEPAVLDARGNTVADNGSGGNRVNSSCSGIVVPTAGSSVVDNIIVGNAYVGLLNAGGAPAHHNLVMRNGADYSRAPGEGDVSLDPMLRDPERGDYRLRAGSPGIGAGSDGGDLGALPFVPAGRAPRDLAVAPVEGGAWELAWTPRAADHVLYVGVQGLAGYGLQLDAGATSPYRLAALPGDLTWRAAMATRDADGNESRLSRPVAFAAPPAPARRFEEDSPAVSRHGTWQRQSAAGASGGSIASSLVAGSRAAFTFAGDQVALYRRIGPDGGRAVVTVDGRRRAAWEFYFAEERQQVPTLLDGLGPGAHVLGLEVIADKHTASTGNLVALDAFAAPGDFAPDAAQLAGDARVNLYRERVGIPPARGAMAIHLAAQAHADYAVVNPGEGHGETAGKPRFTGAGPSDRVRYFGYPVGVWEDMHYLGDTVAAVDGWMETVYHRIPIVHYGLIEAGIGSARDGSHAADVLDMGDGARSTTPPTRYVYTYPVDGQTDVPVGWHGGESPDPLPGQTKPVGYPVSLHIAQAPAGALDARARAGTPIPADRSDLDPRRALAERAFGWWWPASAVTDDTWKVTTAELSDAAGKAVPSHVIHRDNDVPKMLGADVVFVIAREPMAPGSLYRAQVAGTDSRGVAFDVSWSFTTGR